MKTRYLSRYEIIFLKVTAPKACGQTLFQNACDDDMGFWLIWVRVRYFLGKIKVLGEKNYTTQLTIAGLELKKISKSPFSDYRRKNGRQMQKCSRQIVEEQKLKLEPHLISIVFRLPVDCFCGCGTDQNTRYGTPEDFCTTTFR